MDVPLAKAVYAGFWRRAVALLLDIVVVLLAAGAIAALTRGAHVGELVALFAGVYTVGLTHEGGTLGKRIVGLRVVRSDGSRVGVGCAALRELVGRPLSLLALGLGFLWMLDDRRRQTWHDQLADTVVVRELPVVDTPPWREAPPWAVPPVPPAGSREANAAS